MVKALIEGYKRRKSKAISIGGLCIGGDNPIAIQSMTKAKTEDSEEILKQIQELKDMGCEIIRLAIKDTQDARAIKTIKRSAKLPLVADIHFDWRLAIIAIENGIDKIRLNPGNIYDKNHIYSIVRAAKARKIPIRVGVNSGSLPGTKRQTPNTKKTADLMVKGALDYIKLLERFGFYEIVISLKASNIFDTIQSYRKMAKICDYPLHLGLTATGVSFSGAIKSSIALGILLSEGIGDTIRVSLTDRPAEEVRVAKYVLEALDLRRFGPQIISCPTCGRCEVDLAKIVRDLEEKFSLAPATKFGGSAKNFDGSSHFSVRPLRVAVMGCVVNGPGEAKDADVGIAFGRKEGLLFKKGRPLRKVNYKNCVDILLKELS
jgi:(E)-4-hydroxy-3-methylbut-2-enyl-diphosphate synthase